MDLSRQNAMQIVTEISDIIHQHVNMMDEQGVVIASTDPKRLNTYHAGAAAVIADNLEELIVTSDDQYTGARKGTNLPIVLEGEIVGVIGLTGEYDEVVKYGKIIKKMTEILLRENSVKQQKKIDDRIRTRFMDEWILDGVTVNAAFEKRALRLGIDIHVPRRVLVAAIADLQKYNDNPEGQILIDSINTKVRQMMQAVNNGIFTKTATRIICLVQEQKPGDTYIYSLAKNIQRTILTEFGITLLIGVDGHANTIHQSYQQAAKALGACFGVKEKTICLYNSINLEIFLDEVSHHSKEEFVRRIFSGCSKREIESWIGILQEYFAHNGSITQTADQLFIHKNTLQYKLNKLYELTGYNPKNMADAALFYLAIEFYKAIEEA